MIQVKNLTKTFDGFTALSDTTLTVPMFSPGPESLAGDSGWWGV